MKPGPVSTSSELRAQVLGQILRRLRVERGWGLSDLAARLGFSLSERALASYENGTRGITVARLWELCEALYADPSAVLTEVARLTSPPPVEISLDDLAISTIPALRPLQQWAAAILAVAPHSLRKRRLDEHCLTHFATLCGLSLDELYALLGEPSGHCRKPARDGSSPRHQHQPRRRGLR